MSSLLIIKLFWGNHNKNPLKLVAKHHESVHTLGILTPYYSAFIPRAYSQTVTSSQPYQLAVG